MAKIKRIVTSEVEGRNLSDFYGDNSYSFENNGTINYYGTDKMGPVIGPGIVYGSNADSGDGYGNNTIKLVPHAPNGDINDDRYLIIDPTIPNHIHIRAGGQQDNSNAELILGAEDTHVMVSDMSDTVTIKSNNGQYLQYNSPEQQIATIGNIDSAISSSMVRYVPVFQATGLTFTGSGENYPTYNSYYVKSGKMVSFAIEVDCSTVTNFGTGQYKLQLPFPPAVGFNHFSGWANVDTAVNPDVTDGHVILNVDHVGITDVLDLHYLKQAGGAHTPIIEGLFLQGTPVTLTTSSKIYVNGTYISQ